MNDHFGSSRLYEIYNPELRLLGEKGPVGVAVDGQLQNVIQALRASYWHLPVIPFHKTLQKVRDSGKWGYKFRKPDFKRTETGKDPPKGNLKPFEGFT